MVKVSVIVRILNEKYYTKQCIDSILQQSLKDIEIQCIDYTSSLKESDERFKVVPAGKTSIEDCINECKGRYLIFSNGNEYFKDFAFEKIYNNLESEASDICSFNFFKVESFKYKPHHNDYEINNRMFRVSFLKENNLIFTNTFLDNLKSEILTDNITHIDETLLEVHNNNFLDFNDYFNSFDELERLLKENNLFNEYIHDFTNLKLKTCHELISSLSGDNANDFYHRIRFEFIRMNIDTEILEQLPNSLQSFYIRVINNSSYYDFRNFNELIKTRYTYINKQEVELKISKFNDIGINENKRKPMLIVSLTSYPKRIHETHYCIYSLLNQTLKPDEVVLWLAEDEFPGRKDDLPEDLLKLTSNGLKIKWCENLKSYKKLIPSLKQYPDDFIITADDDIFYPPDWLENIWEAYENNPNTIITSRSRIIGIEDNNIVDYADWKVISNETSTSYLNLPTGAGGTLYFPNCLSNTVFEEELFEKLCPTTDDIWFWAMAVLNKTRITRIEKDFNDLNYINIAQELGIIDSPTLWQYNQQGRNNQQFKNILNYFPEIWNTIRV